VLYYIISLLKIIISINIEDVSLKIIVVLFTIFSLCCFDRCFIRPVVSRMYFWLCRSGNNGH